MLPLVSVFCRAPRPGATKTRLTPPLTPEQAAEVSAALLLDLLDRLPDPSYDLVACAADVDDLPVLRALVPAGMRLDVQPGGGLGARMAGVAAAGLAAGRPAAVLTGSDLPALGPAHVRDALAALDDGADVALCPSGDGGYALVALARPAPAIFHGVPWSSPDTLAVTRTRARGAGLRLAELAPVDDIDRHDDLVRVAARLDDPGAPAAPRLRRVVAALGLAGP